MIRLWIYLAVAITIAGGWIWSMRDTLGLGGRAATVAEIAIPVVVGAAWPLIFPAGLLFFLAFVTNWPIFPGFGRHVTVGGGPTYKPRKPRERLRGRSGDE